jgi:hypothetical protein
MKKEYIMIGYIAAIAGVILLSFLFRDYTIAVPVPLPFGGMFILLLFFSNLIYEVWRGSSPQVISNIGHHSINTTKDIKRVPWHTDLMNKEDMVNKSLGDMHILFPGGVESWGLSVKSTSDYPVFIYPALYTEREGESYRVTANLMRYEYNELPPYIRMVLQNYGGRVKPNSTPIYYGVTSHIDGSATPENLKIIIRERADNRQINELEDKLKTLYKELRRDSEKRSRTFLVRDTGEVEK